MPAFSHRAAGRRPHAAPRRHRAVDAAPGAFVRGQGAVYQADVVETMLRGIPAALQDNDLGLRRRGEILAFAINMEQVADIAERVLLDVEERKIRPGRRMSAAGPTEISELHARLMSTLSLSRAYSLAGSNATRANWLMRKAASGNSSELSRTRTCCLTRRTHVKAWTGAGSIWT